jgi:hypothetical protein
MWAVKGAAAVSETFVASPWVAIRSEFATREDAERWLVANVDELHTHYSVHRHPMPPGKPIDNQDSWEVFDLALDGSISSSRTGRRLREPFFERD